MRYKLPDAQVGFRKRRGTIYQIASICWIIEKAKEFQKNIYFCFIGYINYIDFIDYFVTVWITTNWKSLMEMLLPDRLTCLWRNLYAGQEATIRTGHGTMNWFKIGEGVHQGCIMSSCLLNLYAEYPMWNARLDEEQLESRLLGGISINSDIQMTPSLWQKVKEN